MHKKYNLYWTIHVQTIPKYRSHMDEQIPNPCCTFIKFELKTLAFYGPHGFGMNIQTGNERSLMEIELEPTVID